VDFAVYFKVSSDPTKFGEVTGQPLKDTAGLTPSSSPYNVYTDVGSPNGTIVVSAGSDDDLFINKNYGVGPWTRLATPDGRAYSRGLQVAQNPKNILILNGGRLGAGSTNKVTASLRHVNGCINC